LSRAGGLSTGDMLDRLDAAGFLPFAFGSGCGIVRIQLDELRRSFQGQSDIVWIKATGSPARPRSTADGQPAIQR